MPISIRNNRAAIRVSGVDAHRLLNDVLTANISQEAGSAQWWALLSPQGKIQAEGLICWQDDAFWLDVHLGIADAFLKRMRLYKLRADAEFENITESHRVGWSDTPTPTGISIADPRDKSLGFRIIAPLAETADWVEADTSFALARIKAGIAELGEDFTADQAFPHDIGMDLLSGVDFKKGCYVGQEVVSRMQHRGTARRRPVIASNIVAPADTALVSAGKDVGVLGAVINGSAVAIVRLDRIVDAAAETADGNKVHLALPSWASYRFQDSSGDED